MNIVELLHDLEACLELRTVRMLLKALPLFRGQCKYQEATLKSLKFKRPAHLREVTVYPVDLHGRIQTQGSGGGLLEACKFSSTSYKTV
jgi:hypothetical protein